MHAFAHHAFFRTLSSLYPAPALIEGMVREVGLEPTACGLENRCSIQLSYSRSIYKEGIHGFTNPHLKF
jgi:hypothetical protein